VSLKQRLTREDVRSLARLAAEDSIFPRRVPIRKSGQDHHEGHGRICTVDILVDVCPSRIPKLEPTSVRLQVDTARLSARKAEIVYTPQEQVGCSGQFAEVKMVHHANGARRRLLFESRVWCSVPKEYIPGVEKAIIRYGTPPSVAGFPVSRLQGLRVIEGKYPRR